jgi:predicted aldo/keto reductase-like oxidoreductase
MALFLGCCAGTTETVNISRIFAIFSDAVLCNEMRSARRAYNWLKEEARKDHWEECGQCRELYLQGNTISVWLQKASELLSEAEAA